MARRIQYPFTQKLHSFLFFLRFYLFIFREREREGERERNIVGFPPICAPFGDQIRNPGMCPGQGLNW